MQPPLNYKGHHVRQGGVFRGRALGNFPNHADMDVDTHMDDAGTSPLMGKVLFYVDRHEGAKPSMLLKHEVTPKLSTVLTKLGRSFSPIRSKCFYVHMRTVIHNSSRI